MLKLQGSSWELRKKKQSERLAGNYHHQVTNQYYLAVPINNDNGENLGFQPEISWLFFGGSYYCKDRKVKRELDGFL